MPRWPGRTLLVTLFAALPVAPPVAPQVAAAEPARVAATTVVARLGSADFAERESAQAELLSRGADPETLRALVQATASDDAEVRRRAADTLDALTRHAEGARLLKPRTVRLNFDGVPLDKAVAGLRTLTGANLQLDPRRVADSGRMVRVTSGELPAWEAVERFRQAAGLVELFREDAPVTPGSAESPSVRRSYFGGPPGPAATANQVPVLWADAGTTPPAPVAADRGGPVRVTALPGRFPLNHVVRGSGQVVIHLDIAPPADLIWEQTQEVRILRGEDDTTRPVTAAHPLATPFTPNPNEVMFVAGLGFVNFFNGNAAPVDPGNPRLVPVTLKTDDRLVRSLRVLEGVVVGSASVPNQEVIAVEDLAKSVGVAHAGPGDTKLTVEACDLDPRGRTTLKLVVEGPNPYIQVRQGRRPVVTTLWGEGGLGHTGLKDYRFTDADGKSLTGQAVATKYADDGARQTASLSVTFAPTVLKGGPPVRLVVLGNRAVTLAVPFKLRDVPLP